MAPWTRKQMQTALAVENNWKPTGKAKGFTKGFAKQVIAEGVKKKAKKKKGNPHY